MTKTWRKWTKREHEIVAGSETICEALYKLPGRTKSQIWQYRHNHHLDRFKRYMKFKRRRK